MACLLSQPAAQSPLLQTPASRWLRAPSSSLGGCSIGQSLLWAIATKVFQQPDQPPTCGRHRLRKVSSCRPEVGRAGQHPRGETHCGLLILPPELKRFLRNIDQGVGQRAGDFVAAGAVADLEHCAVKLFGKTHDIGLQKTGFKLKRASLLDELVAHKAGRCHPQDDESDLAVFLAVIRVIKSASWGSGPRGYSRIAALTSWNV